MKRTEDGRNYISGLMALAALGIFAVCVLAVLFAGTGSYSNLVETDRQGYETRTAAGYLAARVRQADGLALSAEQFGGGDGLVICETIDGEEYKTFIYCHDGWLMEYFADADAVDMETDMEFGSRLFPAENLELEFTGDLLKAELTMDGRTLPLALHVRCGEEGSHEK